ncbi:MAG: hypothetical protein NUV51_04565 [Sulfuricaulis sp.]|nr:hypothetical protein [Sulfuricaulis sp.]
MIEGLREPVRLHGVARKIFDDASIWAVRHQQRLVLVSANDHEHTVLSAHYRDAAIDVQGDDLDGLSRWLGGLGYRVYWQVPGHYFHVHAEAF